MDVKTAVSRIFHAFADAAPDSSGDAWLAGIAEEAAAIGADETAALMEVSKCLALCEAGIGRQATGVSDWQNGAAALLRILHRSEQPAVQSYLAELAQGEADGTAWGGVCAEAQRLLAPEPEPEPEPEPAPVIAPAPAPAKPRTIYCHACGHALSEGTKFCTNCGAKQFPIAAPVQKPETAAPAAPTPQREVPAAQPETPVTPVQQPAAPAWQSDIGHTAPVVTPVQQPAAPAWQSDIGHTAPVVTPVQQPVTPAWQSDIGHTAPVVTPVQQPVTPAWQQSASMGMQPVQQPGMPAATGRQAKEKPFGAFAKTVAGEQPSFRPLKAILPATVIVIAWLAALLFGKTADFVPNSLLAVEAAAYSALLGIGYAAFSKRRWLIGGLVLLAGVLLSAFTLSDAKLILLGTGIKLFAAPGYAQFWLDGGTALIPAVLTLLAGLFLPYWIKSRTSLLPEVAYGVIILLCSTAVMLFTLPVPGVLPTLFSVFAAVFMGLAAMLAALMTGKLDTSGKGFAKPASAELIWCIVCFLLAAGSAVLALLTKEMHTAVFLCVLAAVQIAALALILIGRRRFDAAYAAAAGLAFIGALQYFLLAFVLSAGWSPLMLIAALIALAGPVVGWFIRRNKRAQRSTGTTQGTTSYTQPVIPSYPQQPSGYAYRTQPGYTPEPPVYTNGQSAAEPPQSQVEDEQPPFRPY